MKRFEENNDQQYLLHSWFTDQYNQRDFIKEKDLFFDIKYNRLQRKKVIIIKLKEMKDHYLLENNILKEMYMIEKVLKIFTSKIKTQAKIMHTWYWLLAHANNEAI